MWTVVEEKTAAKAIDKLPPQAAEKYAFWLAVVRQSGPGGLRSFKGFHDEKLGGKMAPVKERTMTSKTKKTAYTLARPRVVLSPGDSVRIARELQEMTQAQLAVASGIPQGTISSLEKGRATLGAARAEKLARALGVHPAVLLWPCWEESEAKRVG